MKKQTFDPCPPFGIKDYTTNPVSNTRESRDSTIFSPLKTVGGEAGLLFSLFAVFALGLVFLFLLYRMILTPPAAVSAVSEAAPEARPVFETVGDTGANILAAEEYLQKLGYDTGAADGIFSPDTAAAIRQFQNDCGLEKDGVLTAALAALLRQRAEGETVSRGKMPTPVQISAALKKNDCDPAAYGFRGALLLFQRTHHLRGTGEAGYATLCALQLLNDDGTPVPITAEAEDAARDFELTVLARYLYGIAREEPSLADLHTLTGISCVICNRRKAPAYPDAMAVLCQGNTVLVGNTDTDHLYTLCLRAAEDGFSAVDGGRDFTCGALEYLPVASDARAVHEMNLEHQYIKTEGKLRYYR